MGVRGEMRMIERAIKNRWLTDDLKSDALAAIKRGLNCGDDRAEQTAVRNLIAMEAQNQKDEHKVIDVRVQTRHDELAGIAADLGIEIGAIEAVQREADFGIDGTEAESQPQPNYRT
jgi:uncharacterized Ntn-hydrolase superfamily protein